MGVRVLGNRKRRNSLPAADVSAPSPPNTREYALQYRTIFTTAVVPRFWVTPKQTRACDHWITPYAAELWLPYNLEFKQRGPKRWGGGCNTPTQLVIGSWPVIPIAPPLRPVLLKLEIIRYCWASGTTSVLPRRAERSSSSPRSTSTWTRRRVHSSNRRRSNIVRTHRVQHILQTLQGNSPPGRPPTVCIPHVFVPWLFTCSRRQRMFTPIVGSASLVSTVNTFCCGCR
jgi:hypothetical protein